MSGTFVRTLSVVRNACGHSLLFVYGVRLCLCSEVQCRGLYVYVAILKRIKTLGRIVLVVIAPCICVRAYLQNVCFLQNNQSYAIIAIIKKSLKQLILFTVHCMVFMLSFSQKIIAFYCLITCS